MRAAAPALLAIALGACAGELRPASLDTRTEACASCRMMVSDARFASQVVARGEEPVFFDDLGCLRRYLASRPPAGAAAFVADHRTRAWVPAPSAVYTRVEGLETPMGSHLLAHADAASRDQDPDARGGSAVAAADVVGASGGSGSRP